MSIEVRQYDYSSEPYESSREWELEGEKHRDRNDAYRQIQKARMSSLVAASPRYLYNLMNFAREWALEIEVELERIQRNEQDSTI